MKISVFLKNYKFLGVISGIFSLLILILFSQELSGFSTYINRRLDLYPIYSHISIILQPIGFIWKYVQNFTEFSYWCIYVFPIIITFIIFRIFLKSSSILKERLNYAIAYGITVYILSLIVFFIGSNVHIYTYGIKSILLFYLHNPFEVLFNFVIPAFLTFTICEFIYIKREINKSMIIFLSTFLSLFVLIITYFLLGYNDYSTRFNACPPAIVLIGNAQNNTNRIIFTDEHFNWGFKDKAGKIVIDPLFQEAGNFIEGLAPVKIKNMWGYIDINGNFVIKPRFKEAGNFKNGTAGVRLYSNVATFAHINKKGEIICTFVDVK